MLQFYYGGPEGSLPIAFLFKRFLCLSDLFKRFVSAILFRRLVFLFSTIITSLLHNTINRPMLYLL